MTIALFIISTVFLVAVACFYLAFRLVRTHEFTTHDALEAASEREDMFAGAAFICLVCALVFAWVGLLVAIVS